MSDGTDVRFQFGPPVRAIFLGGLRHAQVGFLVTAIGTGVAFLRFVPGQIGVGVAIMLAMAGVAAAFGTIEGRPFDDWLPAFSHYALLVMRGRRRWFSPAPGQGERATVPPVATAPAPRPGQPPMPDGSTLLPEGGDAVSPNGTLPSDQDAGRSSANGTGPPASNGTTLAPRGAGPASNGSPSGNGTPSGNGAGARSVRRAGKPSPPPPVADWQLIYTSVSGQPMGVLRDRKNKSWVAVIGVQGQSFMLLDEGEQVRRLSSWATVQASMARQGSPISRLQWLERTLTEVGDEMRSFFAERARTAEGTPAHASYTDLLASAQPVTQQHETYLVLQISQSKAGRAIRQAGGGDKGAVAVLYRELDHLQRQLRESDLNVSGFLSGDELALLLRTQFDPEDALALATRRTRGSEPLISARSAWPLATEASWGHYRTDKMYHITYWIAEWPKLGVRPSFLAPLLLMNSGATRTVSVVSEPINTARAQRQVEHAQTARLSDDELRSRAGYRLGARRRREGEALDRRENELADGHAEARYSGYVTVSGSNLDEVEQAAAQIEQMAYQCPVELRRLWGEQDTAFYCTMPLAKGLH
ncbi:MAG: SCO6880 family protein [Acidimicrobiales bacterium]